MKLRVGFVSNSSSSSFMCNIEEAGKAMKFSITSKKEIAYALAVLEMNYSGDNGCEIESIEDIGNGKILGVSYNDDLDRLAKVYVKHDFLVIEPLVGEIQLDDVEEYITDRGDEDE